MSDSALFWLFLTLFCIAAEGFYSSVEMAIVSFNSIRLQYYIAKGNPSVRFITWLLEHPSRLFSTTLFGVNAAMQLGSECSRRFYSLLNVSADWAPITQIFLVLLVAELAPILAARRYPEQMAMAGSGVVYYSARLAAPLVWAVFHLMQWAQRLIGAKEASTKGFISRDELQTVLEMRDQEGVTEGEAEELNLLARNLFTFRDKKARDAMVPLSEIRGLPSHATVGYMRHVMKTTRESFMPVFHKDPKQIIGIAASRDLVVLPDETPLRPHLRAPWFVSQESDLMSILQQFRRNQQTVAVVLDNQGAAVGLLQLDRVLEQLFPNIATPLPTVKPQTVVIDRLFSGDMEVSTLNAQYGLELPAKDELTLAELAKESLGRHPEVGESCMIGRCQLIVEDVSLLDVRAVRIKTR